MKTLLLSAIAAIGLIALSTGAFAHGHNQVHGRFHGHAWDRGVSYYPLNANDSCYRGEWIGGPKWRRYRHIYICG
jgi:hypothetical protein